MRSILQNVQAYDLQVRTGFRYGSNVQKLSADFSMPADGPVYYKFDPNAADRIIVLPSITNGTGIEGRIHVITNIAAANKLTVNAHADDASALVATVPPGATVMVFADLANTKWFAFAAGVGAITTAAITDSSGGTANSATGVVAVATQETKSMALQLADLVNAGVWKMTIPYAFTVRSIGFRTGKPASTAAKAATLTAQVNGVAVTGGVVSLTTANQNATGTLTAGTAITGANTGTAGQTIEAAVSAVTAFVEGDGWIEFGITNVDLANTIATIIALENNIRQALV